ncbi:MAG: hypothetical protein NT150_15085 [Bacteroidetes bacterium]|nr:hypothetical protein [Bacteroidota bacterium]
MENQITPVAQTILDQIQYTDCCALKAWGASEFYSVPASKEYQGGLQFTVDGVEFKGTVKIELRWIDDYVVSFIKSGKIRHQVKSVYYDMLVDVIDYVEGKQPNTSNKNLKYKLW